MTKIIPIIIIIIIILLVFLSFPLTGEIPEEMINIAEDLNQKSESKLELARSTYEFVDNKYTSPIREYLRQPEKVFLKNREKIFSLEMEYVPSNTQNFIYKELLILTGEFQEEDFTIIQSTCTNTPHSYIILNIDGQEVFVDLWMADNSILDETFGCFTNHPCQPDDIVCSEGFP